MKEVTHKNNKKVNNISVNSIVFGLLGRIVYTNKFKLYKQSSLYYVK